jgi:multiple sugar transport system substrate-binding protein
MKPRLRWLLALLALTPARSVPAETTLRVASYGSFADSVRSAIPLWEKKHPDVKIHLTTNAYFDHHNAMLNKLELGSTVPDVMAVEVGFIGRFAESGGLEDLGAPPYDARPLLAKLLRFTGPQATSGRGILAAMPADVGPGTLFYRADLLEKAGVSEKELTTSWESYIEAGKKVRAATKAYLLADAADIMMTIIRADLKDGEGIFFDEDGKVLVDAPRFQRAFELARAARRAGVDARYPAFSNEWTEAFRRGILTTQPMGAWLAGQLQNSIAPRSRGLWRAAQLPGGAFASWGGSFYAIPKDAEHKAEAWEFVRFMCFDVEQQLNAWRSLDAWPALATAQDDPFVDEPMPFLGGQKARQLWKISAAKIPGVAVHRLDPVASDIVGAELKEVLENDKPIERALADARRQIERRLEK